MSNFLQSYANGGRIANLSLDFCRANRTFAPKPLPSATYIPPVMKQKTLGATLLCACAITLSVSLPSCSGHRSDSPSQDSAWVKPVEQDTIVALEPLSSRSTLTIGGQRLTYEYRMQPADSLPVITNVDGARYYDNEVLLTVWRNDSVRIFHRRFLKGDFAAQVGSARMERVGLVGFSYNPMKSDDTSALYFLATVGDPDETAGVNFPVEIRITPSGSMSMQRAEDIETEPLHEGLNEEPNI